MTIIDNVKKVFVFIVGGLVAIIVGAFMLRGNMHLWDQNSKKINDKDDS